MNHLRSFEDSVKSRLRDIDRVKFERDHTNTFPLSLFSGIALGILMFHITLRASAQKRDDP